MPTPDIGHRIELFESYLTRHPRLRLRISCPSQEFSELEMAQGVGRWFSCVRGLWESLDVGSRPDLALLMFQAPAVPRSVERYVLGLVPPGGAGPGDRLARHALLAVDDDSDRHLSEKLLERPDLLRRVRALVTRARERGQVVEPLSCYQASARMDELADRLGLDCRETPTRTLELGSKAGSRQLFRAAGLAHAPGTYTAAFELPALARQMADLTRAHGPGRWLLKINEGYGSGHGLAVVTATEPTHAAALTALRQLRPLTGSISRAQFLAGLSANGAIIEQYLGTPPGGEKRSPSALLFIGPGADGEPGVQLLGTHDQVLGEDLQYLGCRFPASVRYRETVTAMSLAAAGRLARAGVRGHVGVDFLARGDGGGRWDVRAVELNLRQTGTTHPHRTVRALVPGTWHDDGRLTHRGAEVHYTGTDGLISPAYRGLTPADVIRALDGRPDVAFDHTSARGVIPHFWTALEPFGKLGATVLGDSPDDCALLRHRFVELLDDLAARAAEAAPRRRERQDATTPGH
ncbi:hypothetical protein ACIRD3_04275 [Kitasatospora sp. NPDC093550]|uniref:hypothetical protein n=1 Tax=Kitasatospora sp. NPDC093550 TaxID=3364089 RepID=UPI00382AA446